MSIVELSHVTKSFGALKAVDDVSLAVEPGEFFGLLGPNGAGKTTTIRIMLDIFKPDSGSVSILGGPMTEDKKNRIGYMPEERGLYQDIPLERGLVYLASLKGLSSADIRARLGGYLERFDLAILARKKVKELSKGMQQKAQIIATLIHQPELLIIDEPFSGLDPVNTQMVKDLLRDLHRQGATIIMSTHQMHQVEELCDRILLDRPRQGHALRPPGRNPPALLGPRPAGAHAHRPARHSRRRQRRKSERRLPPEPGPRQPPRRTCSSTWWPRISKSSSSKSPSPPWMRSSSAWSPNGNTLQHEQDPGRSSPTNIAATCCASALCLRCSASPSGCSSWRLSPFWPSCSPSITPPSAMWTIPACWPTRLRPPKMKAPSLPS